MKVLLLEDVESVGRAGDVVDVANGFARNVLFPQGKAAAVTAARQRAVDEPRRVAARRSAAQFADAQRLAALVDRKIITLRVPVGPQGKLHGAVTATDIHQELERALGEALPAEVIRLPQPFHEPGERKVAVEFPHGLEAEITVVVERKPPSGG